MVFITFAQNQSLNAHAILSVMPIATTCKDLRYSLSRLLHVLHIYNKTFVKRPLSKRPKLDFQGQFSLNAGQKYCREHSPMLSTFIELPFAIVKDLLSARFTQVLLYNERFVEAAIALGPYAMSTKTPKAID